MKAARVHKPADIDTHPLIIEDIDPPSPSVGEVLIKVQACGVCHTDLHIVEGELIPPTYPITPGHQVVGTIAGLGPGDQNNMKLGDRVGLPWLFSACGECEFCRSGRENLCPNACFTGFHRNGGFAEYLTANSNYLLPLPADKPAERIAPFLCAGIVGYRAVKRAGVQPGDHVALVGFGASAHLMIQVLNAWKCNVSVITRSKEHQAHALDLGAKFAGSFSDAPPKDHQRVIIFTPSGGSVTSSLKVLRPGGVIAINAVHMSDIPSFPYKDLWGERAITSVANATYQDGLDFLRTAFELDLKADIRSYALRDVGKALSDLKHSRFNGEGVIQGF